MTEPPIDPLDSITALLGANSACRDTIAGWVWYCDIHDTHGNADSQDEAECVAGAHETFWLEIAEDDEGCDIAIVPRVVSHDD